MQTNPLSDGGTPHCLKVCFSQCDPLGRKTIFYSYTIWRLILGYKTWWNVGHSLFHFFVIFGHKKSDFKHQQQSNSDQPSNLRQAVHRRKPFFAVIWFISEKKLLDHVKQISRHFLRKVKIDWHRVYIKQLEAVQKSLNKFKSYFPTNIYVLKSLGQPPKIALKSANFVLTDRLGKQSTSNNEHSP